MRPVSVPVAATPWGPQSSLDRVFHALDAGGYQPTKQARDFMALCPAHEERTPSLHVTWRNGTPGGQVVLYCHGCQAPAEDIVAALGLTLMDLYDEPPPPRDKDDSRTWRTGRSPSARRAGTVRGRIGPLPAPRTVPAPDHDHSWADVVAYPYVDDDGAILAENVRRRCTHDGCTAKTFVQRYTLHDGTVVTHKPAGFAPVLYNLPDVRQAVAASRQVWLVEGEKDAETAARLGVVATTNAAGAGQLTAEVVAPLGGASVEVVLDRDGAGFARGVTAHSLLGDIGAQVRLWLPAVTGRKSDLTDHADAGHGLDDLVRVDVDEVQVWVEVTRAEDQWARVARASDEIDWHLQEAEQRRERAPRTADDHARYARRWAAETAICWERIRDAAAQVDRAAAALDSAWADEGRQLVDLLVEQTTAVVRGAHERVGTQVPAAIAAWTSQQVHDDEAHEPDGATVIDFPGHDGTGGGDNRAPGPFIERPVYALVDGCIVQKIARKDLPPRLVQIINLDLTLEGREYLDDSDELESEVRAELSRHNVFDMSGQPVIQNPRRVSHYLFSYTDSHGDRVVLRVEKDAAEAGDFLDDIAVVGLQYSHSKGGKRKILEAVRSISAQSVDHVQYRGTGWRLDPVHGWVYVSYTGLIGADGLHPGHQLLQSVLSRYALPRPTADPARLRRFFLDDSAAILTRFGGRLGAVLCGQAYVAAVDRNPYPVILVGSAGSRKSGLAALAMHHYGTTWDRRRPTASMTDNGSTQNSMKILANLAKNAVAFFDDVTPGKNSAAAQAKLGELLQTLFNQEIRDRASRDGDSLRPGKIPHATGLFTSELMPKFGANARRAVVVPIALDEAALDDIVHLDHIESRLGRATLLASMISWAARDRSRVVEMVREAGSRYADAQRTAGRSADEADSTSALWAGWLVMTTFLVEAGAISADEQQQWMSQVHAGLDAAVEAAQDPDTPLTVGAKLREIIAAALRAGTAYLTDTETDDAPDDDGLAIRLGWRRVATGARDEHGRPRTRLEAKGMRCGYVNVERGEVLLDSPSLEALVKAGAAHLSEPFSVDAGTARRALHEVGVAKSQWDAHDGHQGHGQGRHRLTLRRTIACETSTTGDRRHASRMFTVLDLGALLADDDGDHRPAPAATMPPLWPSGQTWPQTDETDAELAPDAAGPIAAGAATQPTQPMPQPGPSEPSGYPMHETGALVTLLPEVGDCWVCHQPARTAVDSQPVHGPCWAAITTGDDAAYEAIVAPLEPSDREPAGPPGPGGRAGPNVAPSALPAPEAPDPTPPQDHHATTSDRRSVSEGLARVRTKGFASAAAVVADDGIWLPGGRHLVLPRIDHLGDLAELAYSLHLGTEVTVGSTRRRARLDPGVIVVDGALAARLHIHTSDLPEETGKGIRTTFAERHTAHPALQEAIGHGWRTPETVGHDLRAWTKMWREGQPGVWITFADLLDDEIRLDRGALPVGTGTLVERLGRFADLLGTSYHVTPQITGMDLMRALRVKADEEFLTHEPAGKRGEVDFDWCRRPTSEESRMRFVHAYDRGGSYLAGIAGAEMPIGEPVEHPSGTDFDHRLPGYWLVRVPDDQDWRFPSALAKASTRDAEWFTTPSLAAHLDLTDGAVEIVRAVVWPRHARTLDPWYQRISKARAELVGTSRVLEDPDDAAVLALIKAVYTRSIGMLGSSFTRGTAMHQPEWRHVIVAKARAALLRRVHKIGTTSGTWPLAVKTDTVLYASDEADPVKAWPGDPDLLGRGVGQFSVEGTGLLTDQLPFLGHSSWPSEAKTLVSGQTPAGDE